MPTVHENRLKGNYGAAIFTARLSGECLVRPVAGDTDVGVDLYCETVAEGQPFLHFWIQVKAGDQCERSPEGGSASCRFKLDHLSYWARQPVPVFAALVPCEWPVRSEPDIYLVDITTRTLFGVPGSHDSITLSSDYHWRAGEREAVRTFLREVVPATTARLQVSKGVVAPSPTPTPQYVRTTPLVPVARFKEVILHQVRTTAANAVLFALMPGEANNEVKEFCRVLARIVGQFDNDPHWENFMARALSHHADGDYRSALGMYARARDSIQGDEHVRDDPPWQARVRIIEQLEANARAGRPLPRQ